MPPIPPDPPVLIETLWNVKKNYLLQTVLQSQVLIETLWNVKTRSHKATVSSFRLVLIETLWNVKQEREEKDMTLAGINRNIVECKDVTSS